MSTVNSLPSGTYVIHSAEDPKKNDERLIMIVDPDQSGNPVKTEKDKMYKWIVTYYKNDKNYTIEAADQNFYAVTKKVNTLKSKSEVVSTSSNSQRFNISPVIYQKTVYYEIIATDGVFQCEGDGEQVKVVTKPDRADPSVLWDFEECSPYTLSTVTSTYFESDPEGKLLRRFGLSNHFTWEQLWQGIDDLNANAQGATFYKLFFFGRHGQDEHDLKKALTAKYREVTGDKNGPVPTKYYDGFDAALSQKGCIQAALVRDVWDSARCEHPVGLKLPQLSFCSPMRRALTTNTITFSNELSTKNPPTPKMTTLVVENCRERMYTDNSENRHPKGWISVMFSNFQIEDTFTEADKLWDPNLEETFPRFRARGRNVLDRIFGPQNASVQFVSITAHHEWTAMVMEVLGQPGAMDRFRLQEGGVLPLIVQYTPPAK